MIDLIELEKYYGEYKGIKNVNFRVNVGELYGFVGPNGAGKSTTLRVLMGLIKPTDGRAVIDDFEVTFENKKIKEFTSFVSADVNMYDNLTVKTILKINQGFYSSDLKEEINRLVELFDIDVSKYFDELSMGNKKKVLLVCALMNDPKIIILDEPTNGLDPFMKKNLFNELISRTKRGSTVLLSSHNLADIEKYCDKVVFIKDGITTGETDLKNSNEVLYKVITYKVNGKEKVIKTDKVGKDLLNYIKKLNADDFTVVNESLEDKFFNIYQEVL